MESEKGLLKQSAVGDTIPPKWQGLFPIIKIISSRWMLAILHELLDGPKRPSEINKVHERISAKTLTLRLRELEDCGLVHRESFEVIPPRVEYSLTATGRDFICLIEGMVEFGYSWGVTVPPSNSTSESP
jgi:DNA-binding HxlR family transcriptional regulator